MKQPTFTATYPPRPPFRVEQRGAQTAVVGEFAQPFAAGAFWSDMLRYHSARFEPDTGRRLVIPEAPQHVFAPDESAWAASAERRKVGVR